MGNITIQGDLTGDVPGGEVGGASNLTTVGAIPYVSAAKTLNQDPTALFWDATNKRLGVGTASPALALDVSGQIRSTGTSTATSGSGMEMSYDGGIGYLLTINRATATFLPTGIDGSYVFFRRAGNEVARFAVGTGNLLIGTTTDLGYGLHAANKGTNGNLLVFDPTATTGTTKAVFAAGQGQSGNLTEWRAYNATPGSGTLYGSVNSSNLLWNGGALFTTSNGAYFGISLFTTVASGSQIPMVIRHAATPTVSMLQVQDSAASNLVSIRSNGDLNFASGRVTAWTSTNSDGTPDLSLSRASAGVLQVGDGGSNANGVVSLTRSQHAGVLVAALPAAAAGNAGSIQYVTDANATTIGSTVAGGGANKVLVWSNGTAWKIFAN